MKRLKNIFVVLIVLSVSCMPSFSATETGVIYDTFETTSQLRESCTFGGAYGYSSWSKAKVDNIGYHPQTKNWAKVSGYHYTVH